MADAWVLQGLSNLNHILKQLNGYSIALTVDLKSLTAVADQPTARTLLI